jgi:hypothetical protein
MNETCLSTSPTADAAYNTVLVSQIFPFTEKPMALPGSASVAEIMPSSDNSKPIELTRIPHSKTTARAQTEVNRVPHVETVAGRANDIARTAGETPVSKVFPYLAVVTQRKQRRKFGDVEIKAICEE